MSRVQPYTFQEVQERFVTKAARYVARRYGRFGVTFDDAQQECFVWLYGRGKPKVERWLAASPQQSTRIYRSLLDAAMQYAELEKAARSGYSVDDIEWYTPRMIEGLMPLVLDETFSSSMPAGVETNNGDLLITVLDIRRAIAVSPEWVRTVVQHEPGCAGWDDAVQHLINLLGGSIGRIGKRRVLSNATAQSITANQEAE